ncbi:NADPH-dependent ferric siderophore reductase [Saccharothrix coeruleofusca]|uniref:siderophore-interacting protein n=1 Tax=Saccharothrix coeruleofusca TaxID=33919 RepID=UPI001AE4D9FA|nr:siderophore-interacting protein [Saccharothrix coeruleofusca]MBP2336440.1 NADPH-dependent ferric siderophore reductase [Saccharothrix coeruleofusca]
MLALHVTHVERVTPHVVRVSFTGPGLEEFPIWPDQQLKLLFPRPGHGLPELSYTEDEHGMGWYRAFTSVPEQRRPWMRSYTVRRYDPLRQEIAVDFVLHEHGAGPATRWAASARPGDTIGRYGPAAAYARPLGAADWYLFAGDETAVPAIATLVASLPPATPATAVIEVRDEAEEQRLPTRARLSVRWVHRGDQPPGLGDGLLRAVRATDFPPGEGRAWVAGEAGVVRAIRAHLVRERGLPKPAVDFSGYWRLRLTQDDAPTEEDLAEAREKLAATGEGTA